MRVKNVQSIDIAGIDPAEPAMSPLAFSMPINRIGSLNLPFTWCPLEIGTLVSVLGIDSVRVDRPSHIIFLDDNAIKVNESLGDHVKPLIRQSLCLFLVPIAQEPGPGEHLLRCPAVREVPLPIGSLQADWAS